jgi:hypothetical protein
MSPPRPPKASTCATGDCCRRCRRCRGRSLRWRCRRGIFLTLPRPICLRFLPCHFLLFCPSRLSCPAGCCIVSLHATASPASASCCAVASCSSTLTLLVRLIVTSILFTPPCPICWLNCLEGWARAADHLGPPPSPLATPLPLVLSLLRLLSGWWLCHLSSCRCIPCQRLRLLSRSHLSFLRSRVSCPAGCCVAVYPVRQPQLHQHPASEVQLELVQHWLQVADHRRQHYTPPSHPCPCPAWQRCKQAPPLWAQHRIRRTGTTMPLPYRTRRRRWRCHCC